MPNILFVDDEPNVLAGLRRMLRGHRREWDMTFCESGAEALEQLSAARYDVVVSDMRMPGIDGAELLTRVRDAQPETVRIVLSGHSDQELTLRAIGPAHQYLTKPCDPEQLERTIDTALGLQQRLHADGVRELVAALDTLPSLPTTYAQLIEEITSPNACVAEAGRIIGGDLGMSAKVLQLVNSSFFGLPVRVSDVPHAVALLGLGVMKPLVLSTGVFRQFEGKDLGGVSLHKLVNHSLTVGVLARDIVAQEQASGHASIDREAIEDALVAGLMHDVGRLVIAQARPRDYAAVVKHTADAPADLPGVEREVFGASHAEVGGYLLELWGLPSRIVEAVAGHHQPSRTAADEFGPLAAVHAGEVATAHEAEWDTDFLTRIGVGERTAAWGGPTPATEAV
ncbi:MAG: response regulator [Planctomycetota bacterium]